MPGVLPSTSVNERMSWSSMRWRVITVTDCGVSRADSVRPVLARLDGVTYRPVPSVALTAGVSATALTSICGSVEVPLLTDDGVPDVWAWTGIEATSARTATVIGLQVRGGMGKFQ